MPEPSIYEHRQRRDFRPEEIFYNGKPLPELSRTELLRLAYDALRYPKPRGVEFVEGGRKGGRK